MMVNHRLPWTSEEENFLKVNASKLTLAELAEALGRSESAILNRAKKLGIKGLQGSSEVYKC